MKIPKIIVIIVLGIFRCVMKIKLNTIFPKIYMPLKEEINYGSNANDG